MQTLRPRSLKWRVQNNTVINWQSWYIHRRSSVFPDTRLVLESTARAHSPALTAPSMAAAPWGLLRLRSIPHMSRAILHKLPSLSGPQFPQQRRYKAQLTELSCRLCEIICKVFIGQVLRRTLRINLCIRLYFEVFIYLVLLFPIPFFFVSIYVYEAHCSLSRKGCNRREEK